MTTTCPYCWQRIAVETPDFSREDESVEFVADCEVCCRPIRIVAAADAGDGEPGILVAEPES